MKNMLILTLIGATILSCSSDDDNQDDISHQIIGIIGDWKLVSFVNESTNSIISESDFQNSNQITIDFKEGLSFTGSTIRNNFFGNFSLEKSSKVLVFLNFSTTEVNESEWGNLFYNNLNLNYNQQTKNLESIYSIQNGNLRIYYLEQQYMVFEKL